jgi:hypothetical protein
MRDGADLGVDFACMGGFLVSALPRATCSPGVAGHE